MAGQHDRRPPDKRRTVPVRLTDIPLDVRIAAAHTACRREPHWEERREILAAALLPSDTVYWVAA